MEESDEDERRPSKEFGEPSLSDKKTVGESIPSVPAAAPFQLEAGMRVGEHGRYEVLDKVGEGGMGSVWRVKDTRVHDRIRAMKRILHEYEDDAGVLKRFESEIGAIAKLDHDNIVTVTDAGSDQLGRYLVMDFIKGESLYQLLSREQLSEDKAVAVFQGLCEGVAHAHENGVIHRDIKPANVMINKRGKPILIDFGLARDEDLSEGTRHTGSNAVMGTRYYMAPEMEGGAKSADERSDIYSLGATFFHLLTHEHPNPLDVTEVPTRWQNLITRCCKKRPEARYQNVSELQQAVKEVMGGAVPTPAVAGGVGIFAAVQEVATTVGGELAGYLGGRVGATEIDASVLKRQDDDKRLQQGRATWRDHLRMASNPEEFASEYRKRTGKALPGEREGDGGMKPDFDTARGKKSLGSRYMDATSAQRVELLKENVKAQEEREAKGENPVLECGCLTFIAIVGIWLLFFRV